MRTKNILSILLASFAALGIFFLQSCDSKAKKIDQAELEGYWVLKSMDGKDAKESFKGALPTLQLDFAQKIISGTGGCNFYSGNYVFENNVLKGEKLAVTTMFCTQPNEEKKFLQILGEDNTVSIENGELKLTGKDGSVLLFVKGENAPAELTFDKKIAGTWELTEIDEKPVSEVFKGEDAQIPTISFDLQASEIKGNAGCNNYTGKIFYDNGILVVQTPMATTRMTCPNQEGENLFLTLIADTTALGFTGDSKLSIAKGGKSVLLFEKTEK